MSFAVSLTGKVLKDRLISEAREDIIKALEKYYGRDSALRRDAVLLHEVYEAVYATGYFEKETGAWFEISLRGKFKADRVYQMVSVDIDNSVFDIDYVED